MTALKPILLNSKSFRKLFKSSILNFLNEFNFEKLNYHYKFFFSILIFQKSKSNVTQKRFEKTIIINLILKLRLLDLVLSIQQVDRLLNNTCANIFTQNTIRISASNYKNLT